MRIQRRYDHRLRDLVRETGDIQVATRLGVPRSTAAGWLRSASRDVVSAEVASRTRIQLEAEVARLRRRVELLTTLLRAVVVVCRALGLDLRNVRVLDVAVRRRLIRVVDRARDRSDRRRVLCLIGLTSARYHAWRRAESGCELEDQASCPASVPQRMTPEEVREIQDMVTSPEHRHVPTGTLAILAQRMGRVFASPSTWYRLVRERGWRRPRLRVHPSKPEVGVRASRPDEIWHVDTTLIRLVDGTRAYIHAVIDNFSRRILGWCVADSFSPTSTVTVLLDAVRGRSDRKSCPEVLADAGVENLNASVDELVASGKLRRVVAQVDLRFSNSMIEAWWRTLKHQWLFLNSLDSVAKVRRLVAFYVEEHNGRLPHSAFNGQTPDEMYAGRGEEVVATLATKRAEAREARLASNRRRSCRVCEEGVEAA